MVATAASAALPPPFRRVMPASTASCPPAETAPPLPDAFQPSGRASPARRGEAAETSRSKDRARWQRFMVGAPGRSAVLLVALGGRHLLRHDQAARGLRPVGVEVNPAGG